MRRLLSIVLSTLVLVSSAIAATAKDAAEHAAVGTPIHVTLDKGEDKDYTISLDKGGYWLVWDGRLTSGNSSNLAGQIQLLKNNGAVIDSNFFNWNTVDVVSRTGMQFHIPKPLAARLRIHNEFNETEMWITILPASQMKFLPFSFGGDILAAKIGTDAGVGGSLEKEGDCAYYRITLPAGKWSISLGMTRPDGADSNLMARVDLLDPYGFTKQQNFINVNEIGKETRKETIYTVAKPKTVIFRVVSGQNVEQNYDLTIEKSTD